MLEVLLACLFYQLRPYAARIHWKDSSGLSSWAKGSARGCSSTSRVKSDSLWLSSRLLSLNNVTHLRATLHTHPFLARTDNGLLAHDHVTNVL